MNILAVLPLQKELEFFLQACAGLDFAVEESRLGRMPTTYLPELKLTVALGGLGKAQFATQTQYLIDRWEDWDAVICTGAAGALVDKLAIGDVVVGTQTVEFDIHNKFGEPLLPRFKGAEVLLKGFKRVVLADASFKTHFGPIASGDEDIVEGVRRQELQVLCGALASAWEGAGGARASAFSNLPFVEIRGISDHANEFAAQNFERNLQMIMKNVATVITTWARQTA